MGRGWGLNVAGCVRANVCPLSHACRSSGFCLGLVSRPRQIMTDIAATLPPSGAIRRIRCRAVQPVFAMTTTRARRRSAGLGVTEARHAHQSVGGEIVADFPFRQASPGKFDLCHAHLPPGQTCPAATVIRETRFADSVLCPMTWTMPHWPLSPAPGAGFFLGRGSSAMISSNMAQLPIRAIPLPRPLAIGLGGPPYAGSFESLLRVRA
jgi:hypothetical protein